MSLLCSLGWHSPAGIPRWNDGFYFSTCSRCGRDLVRTAFERWHVPQGFKVVWSKTPPTTRPQVDLLRPDAAQVESEAPEDEAPAEVNRRQDVEAVVEPAPQPPEPQIEAETIEPPASEDPEAARPEAPVEPHPESGSDWMSDEEERVGPPAASLPIQALIDQLGETPPSGHEGEEEEAEAAVAPIEDADLAPPTAPQPPAATPQQRRPSWDFMDDEPEGPDDDFLIETGRGERPPTGMAIPRVDEVEEAPRRSVLGDLAQRFRALLDEVPRHRKSLAIATVIALIVVAGVYLWGNEEPASNAIEAPANVAAWGSPGNPGPGEAEPLPAPVPPSDSEASAPSRFAASARPTLYVTASVLSCRSAPAQQGERLRNLARGDAVELIAHASPWASVSYRGRQCWALERYLSPVKPY